MKLVIDTNILVSALKSRRGASYLLLSLLGSGAFKTAVSVPLVLEYETVLTRDSEFDVDFVDALIDTICALSEHHNIFYLWRPMLTDVNDEMILELAIKAKADYIVTYNKRDFKGAEKFAIGLATPKEILQQLGEIS
jgi:putative PIN family toxin of toxin-antitoxin system